MLLSTVRSKPVHELRLGGEGGEEKKNADIGWILKNLGFVRDSHQICVGITRCKYGLVIVGKRSQNSLTHFHNHNNYQYLAGNRALLSYSDVWSRLIKHYRDNGCIVSGKNFP